MYKNNFAIAVFVVITETKTFICNNYIYISFKGVIPNSNFLKETSVEIDSRNAVVVDKVTAFISHRANTLIIKYSSFYVSGVLQFMKTNIPDVFAAGDVVSFPLPLVGHKRVNIGHWQLAQAHGTTL